jgi:hypothetical protein
MGAERNVTVVGTPRRATRRCRSRPTSCSTSSPKCARSGSAAPRNSPERQTPPPHGVPVGDGLSAYESMLAASGEDERRKDRAGERTAALMRGESWGETFAIPPGDES